MNVIRFCQNLFITLLFCTGFISCGPASKFTNTTDMDLKTKLNQHLQDVRYEPHERNVLDLWLVKSDKPTPLVLYIHPGGFRQGDKKSLEKSQLKAYLETGF